MSELDDLEDISEQSRYGFNRMKRGISKAARRRFRKAQQRGAAENRSVGKQLHRSLERRRALASIENQD